MAIKNVQFFINDASELVDILVKIFLNIISIQNCRCSDDKFRCAYGGCIHKLYACNGYEDCFDASDEDTEMCKGKNNVN